MEKLENFKKAAIICILIAAAFSVLFIILSVITVRKYQAIELPEELQAITEDSAHAVPLYAWRRSDGTLMVDMRNYKPKPKGHFVLYDKE